MIPSLVVSILIVVFYILIISISGKNLLKIIGIEIYNNSISDYIVGFLFLEILVFVFYLTTVGLLKFDYWTHFIPLLLLLIWQAYHFISLKHKDKAFHINYRSYYPVLVLFLIIAGFILYEANAQFSTALSNEGVLHVDMAYHAGITNSMIEFGYPILDLQYRGGTISYHIFTHFICSELTFISGFEAYQIYTLLFPFFGVLSISILMFDILRTQLNHRYILIKYLACGTISFLGSYLLPDAWGNIQIQYLFVSPSHQFQVIFLIIISSYILFKKNANYDYLDYCVLIVLFCFSILTKGSSLPLLLFGFGFLLIGKFWKNKRVIFRDVLFLLICTILGVIIYKYFFGFDNSQGNIYNSFWGVNQEFKNNSFLNIILEKKMGLNTNKIKWGILIISIISFRYYIVKWFKYPVISYSIGMVLIGVTIFLFYKKNPMNFFQAPITVLNLYFGIYLFKYYKDISRINLIIILCLLSLSIYPVSSYGFQMKRWLDEEKNRYYPITKDRIDLYHFLNKTADKKDVIFTPSIYGATNYSGDNFYPAAISRRVFYLGGFEYGNIKYYDDFERRLDIVNNFSFSQGQFDQLKNEDVKFILIEYQGNKRDLRNEIHEIIHINRSDDFEVLYSNSGGVVLKLRFTSGSEL